MRLLKSSQPLRSSLPEWFSAQDGKQDSLRVRGESVWDAASGGAIGGKDREFSRGAGQKHEQRVGVLRTASDEIEATLEGSAKVKNLESNLEANVEGRTAVSRVVRAGMSKELQ
ncbi:uncharacterized protein JCM6883_004792 [Sporobolomyces salmoneus]|uniref:uncharacterized protein n=1 Tax=Sporobolomyces salmoneus TaxID=183962 RepID=UPI00317B7317